MMLICVNIKAQISPGDLATSHKQLEGMGNCTQCHDLGNKVPDQKCLTCHSEIDALIIANRGYHAYFEVKEKNCVACHSDHHGRKFEMTRFDQDAFDHDWTGYTLEGKHATIDCKECHTAGNINDAEIKNRSGTFLGLELECLNCHEDFHEGSLGNECIKCHNFEGFSPVPDFDHDKTNYKLKGAHREVTCVECHPMELKNDQEYKKFSNLKFGDCIDCHKNPHSSSWNTKCAQCHNETSFTNFKGQGNFNHNVTPFELRGKHKTTSCFDCHDAQQSPALIFGDKKQIEESQCIECHKDVHDGKFGSECVKCHNEESFYSVKLNDDFNHNLTDYPLEGMHIGVDCKSCHEGRFTESIDYNYCRNCHDDYHQGEFATDDVVKDCQECHSLDQKFTYTKYGLDDHEESSFPLEGAHMATPCFACHVSEDHWSFRNIGNSCVDCHDDIHQNYISIEYYLNQDCTECHNTETWTSINFDHNKTDWNLEGQHNNISCSSCHFVVQDNNVEVVQQFSDLNKECIACHENPHGNQFEENGVTSCQNCHHSESWFPDKFDHNNTDFPLEGKHTEIDCRACHKTILDEFGQGQTEFKIERFECIDCHS